MDYTREYIKRLIGLLGELRDKENGKIKYAAHQVVDTVLKGGRCYVFGCTHAGILAQEAFYRTGGLAIMNPILPPGLTCDVRPVTATSALERDERYGTIVFEASGMKRGDLLFISSVSGRNGVPVQLALEACKAGVFTIAITSIAYSSAETSRHSCGKRLFEVCDYVIDNHARIGDAELEIEGFAGRVSPTSTVTGAAIINAICAEAAALFVRCGIEPPVFMSANVDGGDEYNAKVLEKYREFIKYL